MEKVLFVAYYFPLLATSDTFQSFLSHPSDQGVQYAGHALQALLKASGVQCGMSREGNFRDNAVAESVFHTLKVERIPSRHYHTLQEARAELFDYIEVFYNRQRCHSTLGYRTLAEL